jgi:hypothetical protein
MATAISTSDFSALQDRVQELELQVREIKAELGSPSSLTNGVKRTDQLLADFKRSSSMTDDEFHKYNQEVRAIIEKQRAADRKRSIAEWDRLYGSKKKKSRTKPATPTKRPGQ